MKIAFLIHERLTSSTVSYWLSLINSINSIDTIIYLLTDKKESEVILRQSLSSENIHVHYILDLIKFHQFNSDCDMYLSKIYTQYWLPRAKLSFQNNYRKIFNSDYQFNDAFYSFTKMIESFLIGNNIKFICLGVWNSYDFFGCEFVEAVSNYTGVKTFVVSRHGLRLGVYDDSKRFSLEAMEIFKRKKIIGLTEQEKKEVFDYCDFNVTNCNMVGKKDGLVGTPSLSKKTISRGIFTLKTRYLYGVDILYNHIVFNKTKYVLFLPNKNKSYRSNYFSPFFSNTILVKSIYASLPIGYALVVKDHPHSYHKNQINYDMLKVIKTLDNCYYVDPAASTDEFILHADIVFNTPSTSIWATLVRFKHIILFGDDVFLLDKKYGVATTVSKLDDLPGSIAKCLNSPPPIENIMLYLSSFLRTTKNIDDNKKMINLNFDMENVFSRIAKLINDYINKI